MARKGIAPLSTMIALAFTSGSSTTSQRPTPKKITRPRTKPLPASAKRMPQVRERDRDGDAGLSDLAIGEPAHAIPPRRSGQSGALGLHCAIDFWRRLHAGGGDGRRRVSWFTPLRQAAGGGVGRAGSRQFHYRCEGQPEPSGEEQKVQVSKGGREQAAEGAGKSGLRAALRFAGESSRLSQASHCHDEGRIRGHAKRPGTRAKEKRQVFSRFHQRMLRRSGSFSAA